MCTITDCLFTSDVIQKFRETVRKDLKLDPLRYFTLASFSWDCALRYAEVKLELQTSIEAHLMIENAIRGGIAVIGNPRHARANNPEMPDGTFNEEEETSFIDFLDFNGLYTSVMATARLPTHGFRFLSDFEQERFNFEEVPEDSDHGYILEVDLSYPVELHEYHDDFPLAPEKIKICTEDLSPYTVQSAAAAGINMDRLSTEERLCLTLKDKKSYTVHYLNLQFYTKHGLKVTKVHRVLSFVQAPFLERFMNFCGNKRKEARSPLYKTIWKNIANLVCGKSYENPRNYKDIRICNSEHQLLKLVAKPTFDCLRVLDDNLTAVQMHKPTVELNRPIAVGFTILELSKRTVYEFFYDFVKTTLAKKGSVSFLAGDTDSLVLKLSGVPDLKNRYNVNNSRFDLSNFPDGHPLKDDTNRMVPGKVKFERPGEVGIEFVALSPKCYSLKTDKGFKQARKGCSKEMRHDLYKQCLMENKCHSENVTEVRNFNQRLYQVSCTKRVLNILDFKRHHFDPLTSVSFGHYSLELRQHEQDEFETDV
ncbi:uncharacterized protein LOC123527404 [Mercenaria mercenaria]|uniref:uncharacterized protein LOC123527404 n=1 Tax=Mercenaria mercenaria TaxID=6596 RepID=UPI00234F0A85|nr:uncharacterized protein LOC123527404 [Mercenaria mercenaria]